MSRLFIVFVMLLSASAVFAQEPNSQEPKATPQTAAPASEKASSTNTAPAAASVGRLHVYRQRRYVGSALAPSIYVDDKQVARVGNGRRFTAKLTPGAHSVRSDDKSSMISLDVKSGEDYYVRVEEQTGFFKGHGKLTLLLAAQGQPEYSLAKPVEPDRRIAKELLEEDVETTPDAAAPKKSSAEALKN